MIKNYSVKKLSQTFDLFKGKTPLLSRLDVELTERCDNACIHCYINLPANDEKAKSRELSTDQWKGILKQAADLGAFSIRLTGGEPLIREDFVDIYLYARSLGMKVMIFTNAKLITREIADLFVKIPPMMKIEISVYGMNAESYNAVTQTKNAFGEFQYGLNLLMERNIPFVLKSVVLPPNKNEIDEFENWVASLSGDIYPSYSLYLDLRARRDSCRKNQRIKSLRISPVEAVAFESRNKESFQKNMTEFIKNFLFPQGDELFACGAGESGCVDAYGYYQMCTLLRHPDFVYDLKKGTIHDALTEVFPRFKEERALNPDYLSRCSKCFIKGLCEQCPAKSWMEHGTLDTPVDYLCQVAHEKARHIGLLSEGEWAWEIENWRERIEKFVVKTEFNQNDF